MNENVQKIKNAVLIYKEARQRANERIQYVKSTYGSEAGEAETRLQEKQLAERRASAEAAIRAASSTGRAVGKAWGSLDGNKLTDDIKLLESGIVDADAFEGMKTKYKDNYTMLSALRKYGENQNSEAIRTGGLPTYKTQDIPTADAKVKAWDTIEKQTLDMLNILDGSGRYADANDWSAAFDREAMPERLEHLGEDLK